ncbi:MAG: hypothetical protein K0U86_12475 [Planctomycetes bacterium]|nr:hypothetical protein [Planctomycetota bacterium]MCH9725702.1 hypothetical protein [Planctomycetota bacterium]MCH9777757.1 hypothetical protein [Planctomycetota bacterium]MCH9791209.1 hypothetical protein [Planctomycetota bacterium]
MCKNLIRRALLAFVLIPVMVVVGADEKPKQDAVSEFTGTWSTISGTNSVIFSIKDDGEAVMFLLQSGAYNMGNVPWKRVPGGILIEGLPRFRFWKGRNRNEARVEMEALPPEMTSEDWQEFPLSFFMRRASSKRLPKQFHQRSLPKNWGNAKLPPEWDQSAGRRRVYREK